MKKIYYKYFAILQTFVALSTLINVVYCLIVNKVEIFFASACLSFVPLSRYIESGNSFQLLILLLFLTITLILYVVSSYEVIRKNLRNSRFLLTNIVWIHISNFSLFFLSVDEFDIFLSRPHISIFLIIFLVSFLILLIFKLQDQNKFYRSKKVLDFEDPLPENFKLHAKSYKQIKRTALGVPVICFGVFIFNLLLVYINNYSPLQITFRNLTYFYCILLSLIVFFGIIIEYRKFKQTTGTNPPTKNFLRNLIIIQIITIILFSFSFVLLTVF